MHKTFLLTLVLSLSFARAAEEKPQVSEVRQKIGPVYTPPVQYKGSLYFLASTGVLYTSDLDLTKTKELFKTKIRTVAEILLDGAVLYFGDGLHEDRESNLYAFDLEKMKLLYTVSVKGHIEKRMTLAGELLITGLGPSGLAAFDKKTGKQIWKVDKPLHVDSTPVVLGNQVFVGSIYDTKAILALDVKTGNILWSQTTAKSPKSDLILSGENLISLTSDGDLMTKEREIPAELLVLDIKTGKVKMKKELRGSNYFPQLVEKNKILLSLTTGDIISLDLKNGKITVVDQYPEPFLASTFSFSDKSCAISVMGRLFCYKDKKKVDQNDLGEMVIGKVSPEIDGRVYIPSRAGFAIIKK